MKKTLDLRELGVHTIGARARLRAAAREWLQHEGTQDQPAALTDQPAQYQCHRMWEIKKKCMSLFQV